MNREVGCKDRKGNTCRYVCPEKRSELLCIAITIHSSVKSVPFLCCILYGNSGPVGKSAGLALLKLNET